MLALIAILGILAMLLLVTTSVAYLILPRGRMCPRCGRSTSSVVLRRLLHPLSRWIQWRWCSRCGWEGPGRKGPEVGVLDPPADHQPGFRWGHRDLRSAPAFHEPDDEEAREPTGCSPARPSGFYSRKAKEAERSRFKWRPSRVAGDADVERPPCPPSRPRRPWYLAWVSKKLPGLDGDDPHPIPDGD